MHKVLGKYTSDLLILPDFFLEWTSGSRCEGHIKKKKYNNLNLNQCVHSLCSFVICYAYLY